MLYSCHTSTSMAVQVVSSGKGVIIESTITCSLTKPVMKLYSCRKDIPRDAYKHWLVKTSGFSVGIWWEFVEFFHFVPEIMAVYEKTVDNMLWLIL